MYIFFMTYAYYHFGPHSQGSYGVGSKVTLGVLLLPLLIFHFSQIFQIPFCGLASLICFWRDDFGFPIVNFPWLIGDVPKLPSYGVYISQLVRFARCCTSVSDFNSKNLQITSKLLTHGYRYHKLRKNIQKVLQVILWHVVHVWCNIVSRICYGRNLSSSLLRWSSPQTKEGQTWSEFRRVGL